jgi:multidrug efflux pump subunit AcrA (membrane-fusion protein)
VLAVWCLVMIGGCGSSAGEGRMWGTAAVSGSAQGGRCWGAPVERVRLVRSALPQLVKLPGQLASFEEVSIFPKVNGYVKDVWVDVGSHVKKGQC